MDFLDYNNNRYYFVVATAEINIHQHKAYIHIKLNLLKTMMYLDLDYL